MSFPLDELSHVGHRLMDEVVLPLRDVNIDEQEYALLKSIVFFDPSEYDLLLYNIFVILK